MLCARRGSELITRTSADRFGRGFGLLLPLSKSGAPRLPTVGNGIALRTLVESDAADRDAALHFNNREFP